MAPVSTSSRKAFKVTTPRRLLRRQSKQRNGSNDDNDSDSRSTTFNSVTNPNSHSNTNSLPGGFSGGSAQKFGFPCCFIEDNDPRATYAGPWTLNGTQFSTQHITTTAGSSVTIRFTGAGIAVFGTIPISNDTVRPPTAQYSIDNVTMPQPTLPFAVSNIPNQPLFSTTSILEVKEHILVINITDAPTPYTIQRFFVPANFTTAKDMIGQIPPTSNDTFTPSSSSSTASTTRSSTRAGTQATTASWQSVSSMSSGQTADLERTVTILAATLGTLIFLILVAVVVLVIARRRASSRTYNRGSESKGASHRETFFGSWLTSTESILRNDSIFRSPPRTPRSLYSRRSEARSGRSPSVNRASIIEASQAPPLPPKPVFSRT